MNIPQLSLTRRLRRTPFTDRVQAHGVSAFTVYNHMLLPAIFESQEADYWHLCEHVQVWDVSSERQVEIKGPDCARLIQLMTPRSIQKAQIGQCFYLPLCDEQGMLMNDPVGLKLAEDHWWLSLADSDILLWAKGLATGFGLDVALQEPDVFPLAVQGPKADELIARVFGEQTRDIRFFRFEKLPFMGHPVVVARSGWSKQGGFEIYLDKPELAEPLWDELFKQGEDLNVRAGCPNGIERIESSLLSFGNDMDYGDTPFDCGLNRLVTLKQDIDSLSQPALREYAKHPKKQLFGLVIDEQITELTPDITIDGQSVGEVRSHVWSPRYQRHLAIAMCQRESMNGITQLQLDANQTQISARVTKLPFDFADLGLA